MNDILKCSKCGWKSENHEDLRVLMGSDKQELICGLCMANLKDEIKEHGISS